MKNRKPMLSILGIMTAALLLIPKSLNAQEKKGFLSFEDYVASFLDANEDYLAEVEEWHVMIGQLLEEPACINSDEADFLAEYKIISLYQLNKLKEYRYMYGDLLSVYELGFIDGWDFQTVRKVIPLVTADISQNTKSFQKFNYHSIHQRVVIKMALETQKTTGYENNIEQEAGQVASYYGGSPLRLALRYDLSYRNKVSLGFRAEKDPGEPLLVKVADKLKAPDLTTGYLVVKRIGPISSVILGNYRISFGYGINISGGMSSIRNRSGLSGMAYQVKPQTSISESGYYRGTAFTADFGRLSLAGFVSSLNADGSSLRIDTLNGKPISFTSISNSGLHRSSTEIANRKKINEKTAGIILVFRNSWMKTGLITVYNRFNAAAVTNDRAYSKFGLNGKDNLVTGLSTTVWLHGISFFSETSVSKNMGMANLSGLLVQPVPGFQVKLAYRNFGIAYQNWNGSGFLSSSKNSSEKGILANLRCEFTRKWLFEIMVDQSHSSWISYDLDSPSRRSEIRADLEKAWNNDQLLHASFRYISAMEEATGRTMRISHPDIIKGYRGRLEWSAKASNILKLKSRFELNIVEGCKPSWLVYQDLEWGLEKLNAKIWIRTCYFEALDFEAGIYAYENDVLYDFTSFMHYGKGLRGVVLARLIINNWMDLWIRASTVYYTNKNAGSGWEEASGKRQNEIEVQVKFDLPG